MLQPLRCRQQDTNEDAHPTNRENAIATLADLRRSGGHEPPGDPERLTNPLSRLQYELLADGTEIERFHASEDRRAVRDRVFDIILATGGFDFDAGVIEKRNARAVLDDEAR